MAIALEGRLMWRRTAPFHLQLKLEGVPDDRKKIRGPTQIHGRTVRVFRSDSRLAIGDRVEFPLWVCEKGDEPTGPAFIYSEELAKALYMEAYLQGDPPNCQLAAYEFSVIGAPCDKPLLTPEQLEDYRPLWESPAGIATQKRKRWQFWRRITGA